MGSERGSPASRRCMWRWASDWRKKATRSGLERRSAGWILVSELADDIGGGEAFDGGDDGDAAAVRHHVFVADDGLDCVVAAFDEDIGFDLADELKGRVFGEEDDGVDGCKGGHDAGTLVLADDGACGAL